MNATIVQNQTVYRVSIVIFPVDRKRRFVVREWTYAQHDDAYEHAQSLDCACYYADDIDNDAFEDLITIEITEHDVAFAYALGRWDDYEHDGFVLVSELTEKLVMTR